MAQRRYNLEAFDIDNGVFQNLAAKNDNELVVVVSDSTCETFFDECWNERPLAARKMAWKSELVQMLTFHFSLAKLQGTIDQFREGLGTLGVLEAIQDNAQAMKPFFMWCRTKLTAGM